MYWFPFYFCFLFLVVYFSFDLFFVKINVYVEEGRKMFTFLFRRSHSLRVVVHNDDVTALDGQDDQPLSSFRALHGVNWIVLVPMCPWPRVD